ncbi:NAD(P)/FAD-dependent oxidoreductase [Aquibacillus saliphilus]|uniref:NAD(P)/FAD-dependent oxidoreductase n=1 Tax=Aquibacillus saliphilus TaxID=1909422 RepID=UPI001CF0C8D8|nr:NAD(P)/FAD-dependent oxidoreductase [Aquibacillus saliphilus]
MEDKQDLYDVTIIGGGTTGLFAAFYSGMRDMKTKIIEYHAELGGKVAQFFPEKRIYDVGGLPGITGDKLVKQMDEQAKKHDPTIVCNQWVESINKLDDGTFVLSSHKGDKHYSKTIILATGMGAFETLAPKIENANSFEGSSLHYTLSNFEQFINKKVMISSTNRIGIEWALKLVSKAREVYLINSGQTFQFATDEELNQLNRSEVTVKLNVSIASVEGEDGFINQVIIKEKDNTELIEVDHLLFYDGVKLERAPFEIWGANTEKNRVIVDSKMATNIAGIFVAGDAAFYSDKAMLIASGYTEAITAVTSAKKYMEPKANAQVYSTVIYRNQK